MPDPQPEAHCLHFMLVPSWWEPNGTNAILMVCREVAREAYLNLAEPDHSASEVLPRSGWGESTAVDVYTSEHTRPGRIEEPESWMQPSSGTVLWAQTVGYTRPLHRSIWEIIRDTTNDISSAGVPDALIADPNCFLLLGAGDTQVVLQVAAGPLAPQMAAVLDMQPSRL